jgi:hypothetical protein
MLTVKLRPKVEKALAEMASETGYSAEQIAQAAIIEAIGDWQDARIALERLGDGDNEYTLLEDILRDLDELEKKERAAKPAAE